MMMIVVLGLRLLSGFFRLLLIPGSGSFRHETEMELLILKHGSSKFGGAKYYIVDG